MLSSIRLNSRLEEYALQLRVMQSTLETSLLILKQLFLHVPDFPTDNITVLFIS